MTKKHYCLYGCKSCRTVTLAPRECLLSEGYYSIIWRTFVDLNLSRRELAEKIVDIFRDMCCANLEHPDGEDYELPEFDDAFSEDESRRWFGSFLKSDLTGQKPKYVTKIIKRLELLDLAAKLINPMPFRAIGQDC